ncbi:hypothetical protein HK102_003153 [Quaeritorhiza haematococci]|nr:hypothetical protein HK102_003153 [Quaeritorhiza haematococci]
MADDEYESVLLVIRECYIYRVPPRSTSRGYRAAEWDVNQFLWTGRVRVIAKGDNASIRFEDATTGEVFAVCPYDLEGTAVEPVLDSSRYFVVKIVDQASGKHAFVGVGFPERSYAFDFNVALQDHVRRVRKEKDAEKAPKQAEPAKPAVDYSLKEGQTISININSLKTKSRSKSSESSSEDLSVPFLPPPPSSKPARTSPKLPRPTSVPHTSQAASQLLFSSDNHDSTNTSSIPSTSPAPDPFAQISMSSSGGATASTGPGGGVSQTSQQQGNAGADDGWGDFGDFVGASSASAAGDGKKADAAPSGWTTF